LPQACVFYTLKSSF